MLPKREFSLKDKLAGIKPDRIQTVVGKKKRSSPRRKAKALSDKK